MLFAIGLKGYRVMTALPHLGETFLEPPPLHQENIDQGS